MINEASILENVSRLLETEGVIKIVGEHHRINELKKKNAYNLFSLSTYTSHLENFHSDVIASFLNSNGLHSEGNKFLKLFIDFLNRDHDCKLNVDDYENAEVLREKGRIDIWIRDKKTRKAILIENKINNAVDQPKQVENYYFHSEQANCKVEAIVYLTLDGEKALPIIDESIRPLLHNIGAYTNERIDLASGWLEYCLEASSNNPDTLSLVNEYVKLLKHLSNKKMDTKTIKTFYDLMGNSQATSSINALIELRALLPKYRIEQIKNQIKDFTPFTTTGGWEISKVVFDHYLENQIRYKLDIYVDELGFASILFWSPLLTDQRGAQAIKTKLTNLGLLHDFEVYDAYGYAKFFRFGEDYNTLAELDDGLVEYVKQFMLKLKQPVADGNQN